MTQRRRLHCYTVLLLAIAPAVWSSAQPVTLVTTGPDGRVTCPPYDAQGDVIPDFSHCGYGGGGVRLPRVPTKIVVSPQAGAGDDLPRLQEAVDTLAKMPADANGFRGALLLKRGVYRLIDTLRITTSGIVLCGEGDSEQGTVLYGIGVKAYTLVSFEGKPKTMLPQTERPITDDYVPTGTCKIRVGPDHGFAVGDTVCVGRNGNAEWIHVLKMDRIPSHFVDGVDQTVQWKPFVLQFDRVVTAVDGDTLTLDAPLGNSIDKRWGGGTITKYDNGPRIREVGIENLFGSCTFDPSVVKTYKGMPDPVRTDEKHAKRLVAFDNAQNVWARDLGTRYLEGVVSFAYGVKFGTTQDCHSVEPISQIVGGRRYSFFSNGELTLWQRCQADQSRHAFVYSSRVCGPNVFLDCTATHEYANSEAHHRWSVCGLYDSVHGNVAVNDRGNYGTGHGWGGANYLIWNCEGALTLQSPPTAGNFSVGFVGEIKKPLHGPTNARMESTGQHVEPRSLYLQQLTQRLGPEAVKNIGRSGTAEEIKP